MNRAVTIFLVISSAAFLLLGVLALVSGIYVIGAILVIAGAFDVATTIRMRRTRAPVERARPPRPEEPLPEPVPLPDARSLGAIPEPVTVCSRCGFLAIRSARNSGGAYVGGGALLSACYCPRCGYEGLPIRFERRVDYADFVRELQISTRSADTQTT